MGSSFGASGVRHDLRQPARREPVGGPWSPRPGVDPHSLTSPAGVARRPARRAGPAPIVDAYAETVQTLFRAGHSGRAGLRLVLGLFLKQVPLRGGQPGGGGERTSAAGFAMPDGQSYREQLELAIAPGVPAGRLRLGARQSWPPARSTLDPGRDVVVCEPGARAHPGHWRGPAEHDRRAGPPCRPPVLWAGVSPVPSPPASSAPTGERDVAHAGRVSARSPRSPTACSPGSPHSCPAFAADGSPQPGRADRRAAPAGPALPSSRTPTTAHHRGARAGRASPPPPSH